MNYIFNKYILMSLLYFMLFNNSKIDKSCGNKFSLIELSVKIDSNHISCPFYYLISKDKIYPFDIFGEISGKMHSLMFRLYMKDTNLYRKVIKLKQDINYFKNTNTNNYINLNLKNDTFLINVYDLSVGNYKEYSHNELFKPKHFLNIYDFLQASKMFTKKDIIYLYNLKNISVNRKIPSAFKNSLTKICNSKDFEGFGLAYNCGID